MSENNDENNMRLIFRPTKDQYNRIQEILETDRYKTLSELIRHALNIGLDRIERDIK